MMTVLMKNFTWLITMMTVLMNFSCLIQMKTVLMKKLNFTDPDDDSNRKELIELIQMMAKLGKTYLDDCLGRDYANALQKLSSIVLIYTEAAELYNIHTNRCGYLYVIIYTKNSYMYLSQN